MIQEQKWGDFTRVLVVDEENHGSVIVKIPHSDELKAESSADAILYALYVDEPYRHKGVAKQLMEMAEAKARNMHCKTIALEWDRREAEQWVFNFYERSGYVEKEFGRYNALMVKEL